MTPEREATLRRYFEDGNPTRSDVAEMWAHINELEALVRLSAERPTPTYETCPQCGVVKPCGAHDPEAFWKLNRWPADPVSTLAALGEIPCPCPSPAVTGWQPIERLTDSDRLCWMFAPKERLWMPPFEHHHTDDIRIATKGTWTWATHFIPLDVPLPPASAEASRWRSGS